DPANSVTVSVTEGGTIAWNKDPVTLEEFIQKLQNYAATDPDPKVLINGDERASFAQAVYAFDEARKAGIEKVLIETRVRPPTAAAQ
ncbi:MAG TPA: biopolymer transporter ExbD, partial [Opitutaceae bacterium]